MRKIEPKWAAALAAVANNAIAVAASNADLRVSMAWKAWMPCEVWEVCFGEGELLADFLDQLPAFVAHHCNNAGRVIHQLRCEDDGLRSEAIALLANEFGAATGDPVAVAVEPVTENQQTYYPTVVLFDPRGSVKPATIITDRTVGRDPNFQSLEQRLGRLRKGGSEMTAAHPDDELWQAEKAGQYKPPTTLRELLELWSASQGK